MADKWTVPKEVWSFNLRPEHAGEFISKMSVHGLRLVPVEATEEMIEMGAAEGEK